MPFIPFFSDTTDITPDFELAWRRHGRTCKHDKLSAKQQYYRRVRKNRFETNYLGETTIEETEMRTLGYTSEPSEEFVKRIYGDNYVSGRKPKLRYDKNRKPVESNLEDRINQIRNSKGNYAPKVKRRKPYLDQEARRRNLSDDKNYDGGSGIGISMIMAFVGIAIMLLIGIMIFGAVSNSVDPNYGLNSTANYPPLEYQDPFEMLLSPFYQLKNMLGELVGLDDFPMWALLPLIIGVMMVVIRTFGVLTARE